MACTASFEGMTFKHVEAYRISAYFKTRSGFEDRFFVYLWDRMAASTIPDAGVSVGPDGSPLTGRLSILGDGRDYAFDRIKLMYALSGATRKERFRFAAFQYPDAAAWTPDPVKLNNSNQTVLATGALGESYMYRIGDPMEQLLGEFARVSADSATVVKLVALRNSTNCFLKRFLQSAQEELPGNKGQFDDWTIETMQGSLRITPNTLQGAHLEEVYGECRAFPVPALAEWLPSPTIDAVGLLQSDPPNWNAMELLAHEGGGHTTVRGHATETVECATLLFSAGAQRGLQLR